MYEYFLSGIFPLNTKEKSPKLLLAVIGCNPFNALLPEVLYLKWVINILLCISSLIDFIEPGCLIVVYK